MGFGFVHFPAGRVSWAVGQWWPGLTLSVVGTKSESCFLIQGLPSSEDSTSLQDRCVPRGLVTCPSASVHRSRSGTCMLTTSALLRDCSCILGTEWHSRNRHRASSVTHKNCSGNWSVPAPLRSKTKRDSCYNFSIDSWWTITFR